MRAGCDDDDIACFVQRKTCSIHTVVLIKYNIFVLHQSKTGLFAVVANRFDIIATQNK